MSAAGTYNYHPKVEHPNKIYLQMTSGGFQKPFYFGGSQVEENLGFKGSGIHTPYISHVTRMKRLSASGRGINTTASKLHKIYLPKHLSSIKQVI